MPDTTTTTGPLAPLARAYAFNDVLLDMASADFKSDDWLHRPGDANHALWVLGHVASSRRWQLRFLANDSSEAADWEKLFDMGTKPGGEGDGIDPALLVKAFKDAGGQLRQWLASVPAEQAAAVIEAPFPAEDKTLAGGAHFLFMHESYHLGQIGLLRRVRGLAGFA